MAGLAFGTAVLAAGCTAFTPTAGARKPVPVIYCSDLFHPHDDPDDHFDLACIYATPGIDLKAIILDQGARQGQKPGLVPVRQMNGITGRRVPAVVGLAEPLADPLDQALGQAAVYQKGVDFIVEILEQSPGPVTIVTVGSVRDLVAAWNRRPELLRAKVGRVYAFIGEASDPNFREYNVGLDVHAYVGLMRSDLPLYWVPCFDGGLWQNQSRASYWQAAHRDLLGDVSERVMNYFVYALMKSDMEPLAFLDHSPDPKSRAEVMAGTRNLWCCAVFMDLVDKTIVAEGDSWQVVAKSATDGRRPVFDFESVRSVVSDEGAVTEVPEAGSSLRRFRVLDRKNYADAMTAVTSRMLAGVDPLRPAPPSAR